MDIIDTFSKNIKEFYNLKFFNDSNLNNNLFSFYNFFNNDFLMDFINVIVHAEMIRKLDVEIALYRDVLDDVFDKDDLTTIITARNVLVNDWNDEFKQNFADSVFVDYNDYVFEDYCEKFSVNNNSLPPEFEILKNDVFQKFYNKLIVCLTTSVFAFCETDFSYSGFVLYDVFIE